MLKFSQFTLVRMMFNEQVIEEENKSEEISLFIIIIVENKNCTLLILHGLTPPISNNKIDSEKLLHGIKAVKKSTLNSLE